MPRHQVRTKLVSASVLVQLGTYLTDVGGQVNQLSENENAASCRAS